MIFADRYNKNENIINDIIHSSKDKTLINKAIFQLASLYEVQVQNSIITLPISNDIYKNEILSSPYIKDDILSSSLSGSWGPMMTTVGLYRQNTDGTMDSQPVIIARYPQAIMIRKDIDLILKIRIDI